MLTIVLTYRRWKITAFQTPFEMMMKHNSSLGCGAKWKSTERLTGFLNLFYSFLFVFRCTRVSTASTATKAPTDSVQRATSIRTEETRRLL